jgi:hypothetical protein
MIKPIAQAPIVRVALFSVSSVLAACWGGPPVETPPVSNDAGIPVEVPPEPPPVDAGGPTAPPVTDDGSAFVANLEQTAPERTVRVLITVRGEGDAAEAAKRRVGLALRVAGAPLVDAIGGQPLLLVEGTAQQLRAALATGDVVSIQLADAAPSSP